MIPILRLELQHDGFGWILGIEVDVGEELGALADRQSGRRPIEEMLAQSLRPAPNRFCSFENGMLRFAYEFPGRVALKDGSRRSRIIDPVIVGRRKSAPQQTREFGRDRRI